MNVLLSRMKSDRRDVAMPRLRVLMVALTLLLFACQNFLVQTHIHGLPYQSPLSAGMYAPPTGPLPVDQDVCPVCQAMVHAGTYLLPGTVAALPPTLAISLTPRFLSFQLPAQPVSHIWRGRAPPIHR